MVGVLAAKPDLVSAVPGTILAHHLAGGLYIDLVGGRGALKIKMHAGIPQTEAEIRIFQSPAQGLIVSSMGNKYGARHRTVWPDPRLEVFPAVSDAGGVFDMLAGFLGGPVRSQAR